MKVNEIIVEETQIKGFNPFIYDWDFFEATAEGKMGTFRTSVGDKFAVASIKGRLICWCPFSYGSPRSLGEFFECNQAELDALKLKTVEVTVADAEAAYLYIKWDRARPATRAQLAEQFLAIRNISTRFKVVPAVLWRGMSLTPEQFSTLKRGEPIPIENRQVSSWTTMPEAATAFMGTKHGVLIEKHFNPSDIVVNLQSLDDEFHLPLVERWSYEYEVLVHGNGIGDQLNPAALKLKFGRRTTDGGYIEL